MRTHHDPSTAARPYLRMLPGGAKADRLSQRTNRDLSMGAHPELRTCCADAAAARPEPRTNRAGALAVRPCDYDSTDPQTDVPETAPFWVALRCGPIQMECREDSAIAESPWAEAPGLGAVRGRAM